MKTLMMRCLTAVALLLLYANATAQSLRCPSPLPPLNVQNGVSIFPSTPNENDQLFYWAIGEELSLDSSNVQRSGNAIVVNVFIYNRGDGTMLPPNCLQIPMGSLPAGTYSLTINEYHRFTAQIQYPNTPILIGRRTLVVAASNNAIPTLNTPHYLAFTLLLLSMCIHFVRHRHYKAI